MKGRAMRTDETPTEYKKEREESWSIEWNRLQKERGFSAAKAESNEGDVGAEEIPESEERTFVPAEKHELAESLAGISQDEYGEWLSENMLDESDIYNQLVTRPEFRSLSSKERADIFSSIRETPEYSAYKQRIEELDQFWLVKNRLKGTDGVRTVGSGSSWNNFEINGGTIGHSESKGYLTFNNPTESLTPQKLSFFMEELQKAGYNGQVKVPTLPSGLFFRFDNLVFHGNTDEDTKCAMEVAQAFFKDELAHTQVGKDGEDAEGKHTSHSDLLAEKVKNARLAQKKS